jgi:hypothetical protein
VIGNHTSQPPCDQQDQDGISSLIQRVRYSTFGDGSATGASAPSMPIPRPAGEAALQQGTGDSGHASCSSVSRSFLRRSPRTARAVLPARHRRRWLARAVHTGCALSTRHTLKRRQMRTTRSAQIKRCSVPRLGGYGLRCPRSARFASQQAVCAPVSHPTPPHRPFRPAALT